MADCFLLSIDIQTCFGKSPGLREATNFDKRLHSQFMRFDIHETANSLCLLGNDKSIGRQH